MKTSSEIFIGLDWNQLQWDECVSQMSESTQTNLHKWNSARLDVCTDDGKIIMNDLPNWSTNKKPENDRNSAEHYQNLIMPSIIIDAPVMSEVNARSCLTGNIQKSHDVFDGRTDKQKDRQGHFYHLTHTNTHTPLTPVGKKENNPILSDVMFRCSLPQGAPFTTC